MTRLPRFSAHVALAAAMLTAGCGKSEDADTAARAAPPVVVEPTATSRASNSQGAVNVLLAVEQARSAVQRKDRSGATTHVIAAIKALDPLRQIGLVPIYSELAQESFLAPIESAKGTPHSGDDVAENSERDPAEPIAVRSVTTNYSRVLLDTSVAWKQLNAARSALDGNDLMAADKALNAVEQGVVLQTDTARMPLVRARENLTLASVAVQSGDWDDARVQLIAAAQSLGQYAKIAPARDLADVQLLQRQITGYSRGLDEAHVDAAQRIGEWWNLVADLTDRRT